MNKHISLQYLNYTTNNPTATDKQHAQIETVRAEAGAANNGIVLHLLGSSVGGLGVVDDIGGVVDDIVVGGDAWLPPSTPEPKPKEM
mmetsp:Transcript_8489/g.19003  ORF Transcript_8489/g.19003 Transcript_8489/m.19003 type:complete len:87 (-) Transcript_8489:2787-3047(-)